MALPAATLLILSRYRDELAAGADRPEFRALFHSDPPPGTAVAAAPHPAPDAGPLVPWTLVVGAETEETP